MQVHMVLAAEAEFGRHGIDARGIGVGRCVVAPGKRLQLRLKVILLLQYDATDAGDHRFELSLRDGDGKPVDASTPEAKGFQIGGEGMAPFILLMAFLVPAGRYQIRVDVDGTNRATWPFHVDQKEGGPGV